MYGYLYNAVKFKLSTHFRDQHNKKRNLQHFYRISGQFTEEHGSCLYETKELEHTISSRVEMLPEKCRQAFVLNRYENLSYKDVAAEMGISVKTVEKHISKAVQLLRKQISHTPTYLLTSYFLGSLI